MEEKKPVGHTSIFDDLFGPKDDDSSIFGSLLSPHCRDSRKTAPETEWYTPSKKQQTEGKKFDINSQKNRSKQCNIDDKDMNNEYQAGISTPCHLSSSLYYGGPDNYYHSYGQNSDNTYADYQYKKDDEDDPKNSNMASRGNWWLGSLYY